MKTEIEKQFLKAYKFGGVLHQCIDVIRHRYDLGFLPNRKSLSDTWQNYYNEELPKQIKADTEAFNDTVIIGGLDSSLINEISENIYECTTMEDKERYIHSLIVPFHELSELLYPHLAPKNRTNKCLEELKNDKKLLEQADEDYKEEAHKQLDAIEWFEKNEVEKQNRLEMISKRFRQIMNEPTDDVEKSFSAFCRLSFIFANLLDSLCLTKRIDLLELQKVCGTYLKTHRTITDVDYYIGSLELAQQYIDELPKVNANKVDTKEPQKPPHFIRHFTNDEKQKLFDGLKNGCFLPKDTDYRHFCYVFGGTNGKPFEPLIWQKSLGLLAYMIDTLFSDTDGSNLWETTAKCFVWKEKAPNKNSMKNTVSKYREANGYTKKPKGYENLDNILRA